MTKYPCLHLRSNFGPSSCYILVYLLPIETKKIRRWTEDDKNMSPLWRNGKEYNEKQFSSTLQTLYTVRDKKCDKKDSTGFNPYPELK